MPVATDLTLAAATPDLPPPRYVPSRETATMAEFAQLVRPLTHYVRHHAIPALAIAPD